MGLSYRNRVAGFIQRMSVKPATIDNYKSNPETGRSSNLINESKLTSFSIDPAKTRSGVSANNALQLRLGDSIMHTQPTAKEVRYRSGIIFSFSTSLFSRFDLSLLCRLSCRALLLITRRMSERASVSTMGSARETNRRRSNRIRLHCTRRVRFRRSTKCRTISVCIIRPSLGTSKSSSEPGISGHHLFSAPTVTN